jgi:hypothetical protein
MDNPTEWGLADNSTLVHRYGYKWRFNHPQYANGNIL